MKTYIRTILLVLLGWFSLAVIGVSIGDFVLTMRDFDLTTMLFFGIYLALVILFFWKERTFKYPLTVFCFFWLAGQGANYFKSPESVLVYNRIFRETHHMIPPSDAIAIPDTYHIILQTIIVLAFVSLIVYCITSYKIERK